MGRCRDSSPNLPCYYTYLAAAAEFARPSRYTTPSGYQTVTLSLDYPATLPPVGDEPWMAYSFTTESELYMRAVLDYAIRGNVNLTATGPAVDVYWLVHEGDEWFHAPWMHWGDNGREPIHGLTRERGSRHQELSATQLRRTNNWAVGFYNARAAYTLGQVWQDSLLPNAA